MRNKPIFLSEVLPKRGRCLPKIAGRLPKSWRRLPKTQERLLKSPDCHFKNWRSFPKRGRNLSKKADFHSQKRELLSQSPDPVPPIRESSAQMQEGFPKNPRCLPKTGGRVSKKGRRLSTISDVLAGMWRSLSRRGELLSQMRNFHSEKRRPFPTKIPILP
jgi:hypothetical protein